MKSLHTLALGALLLAVAAGATTRAPRATTWKTFRSETYHYTVRYPGSWYLFVTALRPKLDYLDILSFPPSETWKGVVIKKGGAEISVAAAPRDVDTLREWIDHTAKLDTDVRSQVIARFARQPSGCKVLTRITSLSRVGPATYQEFTDFFCTTDHGPYVVTLVTWKGDPKRRHFQDVALKVALSLRSW
ncbi:MAG TPA: hypothetical protein VNJ12_02940 [Candidatus Dormibacteraeota bacterium]|nr:hypothetical protein [Candidatus Dormibacteraeota bacterium]